MRTPEESKIRWEQTLKQSTSFSDLQRAVKFNGPGSPCVAGCRSVCWKAFLLFENANAANWSHILLENRNTYSALREHYLKYIKHPELLTELSLDPLADDPDSPWNAVRQDEAIRAEILQDVERLPDEPFYHKESTQTLILDILFIWCKLNPDAGGYRQGMHELLAPLLYVVEEDSIDRKTADEAMGDSMMVEMLDSYFIEHDAFALFAKLMERAKSFYEIGSDAEPVPGEQSTIVEKSKLIHEVALMRIDPELANHLRATEILPQIFLIRWIRLLFGREFPFEQLLHLWDTIFAFDPKLELIDLICVAMLIRIRWTLLEADYSVALQLLLKYPAPEDPHGPHTFVDDALYLKDHYNTLGGSSIIMKYTGRTPAPDASSNRPVTPNSTFQGLSIRSQTHGSRSPLSPGRFIQQRGGVEALFQGAAKGVIERGEKLGINQAVRDAMGEIRRNMQDFQEARIKPLNANRDIFTNGVLVSSCGMTMAEMERRNRQLAQLLDEAVTSLKVVAASNLDEDRQKHIEAIEMAAAKTQFVKVYLEDSTLDLPEPDETIAVVDDDDTTSPTTTKETVPTIPELVEDEVMVDPEAVTKPGTLGDEILQAGPSIVVDDDPHSHSPAMSPTNVPTILEDPMQTDQLSTMNPPDQKPVRPQPIPTRSTLAQSSFSWMLEPDTTASASAPSSVPSRLIGGGPSLASRKKRPSSNASRERNAFLFGEITSPEGAAGGQEASLTAEDIFGLEPIRRTRSKSKAEILFGEVLTE